MSQNPKFYSKNELEKIPFPTKGGFAFIFVSEINYCEADGDYTSIFMIDKQKIQVILLISEVLNRLPEETFFRIHDSYVVNVNQCEEVLKADSKVRTENGCLLPIAKRRYKDFIAFCEKAIKKQE